MRHCPVARRAILGAVLAGAFGCTAGPVDTEQLQARFPSLGDTGASRLSHTMPYLLAADGEVVWFLCRFDTDAPVPVSLPDGLEATTEQALQLSLHALERANLGLRFVRVPADEAAIVVELHEGRVPTAVGSDAANTVADCEVDAKALRTRGLDPLPARMAFASVWIGSAGPADALGRERGYAPAEFIGLVLHELGHALGYQGHVTFAKSVMSRNPQYLREIGEGVLETGRLHAPALAALYGLPSGTVVAREPVTPARTQLVDRMARVVEGQGVAGPFARVGDLQARLFWRDARGIEYGLQAGHLDDVLRDASTLVLLPEARTRRVLPREYDVPLESR